MLFENLQKCMKPMIEYCTKSAGGRKLKKKTNNTQNACNKYIA